MLPVSLSSSFSRQQRAQPSHRLSHSTSDISSNVLVFQKNPSWSEGGLGRTVMSPDIFRAAAQTVLGAVAPGVQVGSFGRIAKPGTALVLPFKIVRPTIGLSPPLG